MTFDDLETKYFISLNLYSLLVETIILLPMITVITIFQRIPDPNGKIVVDKFKRFRKKLR